jgi:hypothetical protein
MNFFTSIAKKSAFVLLVTLFSVASVSALNITSPENTITSIPDPASVVYQSIIITKTEKLIMLDWNTASESGNSHFEVERSTNLNDFKTVALVLDGFSTEGSGKRYAFKEDASNAKNGHITYYRLKQFDAYGSITYSAVVKVQ